MGRAARRRAQRERPAETPRRNVRIHYPSGASLVISGLWNGPVLIDGNSAIAMREINPKGAAFLGDPRGVYVDQDTGEVLYNPRMHAQVNDWMIQWLREHPEWPSVAEIPGAWGTSDFLQLPATGGGGLASGTRVRKVNSVPGDIHQDGALGTVVGSLKGPDGTAAVYSVEWGDLPGVPVGIASHRVVAVP